MEYAFEINFTKIYLLSACLLIIFVATFYKLIFNTLVSTLKLDKRFINALIILLPLYILFVPIFYFVVFDFWLFKKVLQTILKVKYGSKFGGMLEGADSYFAVEDESLSIINFLVIFNYDGKPHEFYEIVKKNIKEKVLLNPHVDDKLKKSRREYCGYYFMLKEECDVDEFVSVINCGDDKNEILDNREFQKIMNDMGSRPLPKNNTCFWEVLVGNKPIKWKNSNIKQHLFIFRFHHSLADGVTLIPWFTTTIADQNYNYEPIKTKVNKKYGHYEEKFLNICISFSSIIILPGYILFHLLKDREINFLHDIKLSGEKILLCETSNEKDYINIIKEIKNKVPGTTFTGIMLTAFTGALMRYMKKHSKIIPKQISSNVVSASRFPNFEEYFFKTNPNIRLSSDSFTCPGLFLPTFHEENDLFRALNEVTKNLEQLKNSFLMKMGEFEIKLTSNFPRFLVEYMSNKAEGTFIFSNLPSYLRPLTAFDGLRLDEAVIWTLNRGTCGISILFFAYDGVLKIGLNVDKALIPNEEDAKGILQEFLTFLDLMNKKTVDK